MRGTPELEPLAAFRSLPRFEIIEPAEIPVPYRVLLAHDRDMTSTLENHHGGKIVLRVLNSKRNGANYQREVVLVLQESSRVVEYGAIHISLSAFPKPAQKLILDGQRPLGAIMEASRIEYTSRPKGYFWIESDPSMTRVLGLTRGGQLYGRCNAIYDSAGRVLADIVEILPP